LEWSLFQDSEETIHSGEINDTSYESPGDFNGEKAKIFFLEKPNYQKQKTKQNVIFQLRQFSIFFRENFTDWSLGKQDWLMQRASMWLNLCGRKAVRHLLKKGVKTQKRHFYPFFYLTWQPDSHIDWVTLMPFTSINSTNPRTNLWNFREKILRIGGAGKLLFFEFGFWLLGFEFFFFFFFSQWKSACLNMRYHLFLHYGWFLQKLGKDFILQVHTLAPKSLVIVLNCPVIGCWAIERANLRAAQNNY
jgi:hypothetical protein